jgi:protein TonB
MIVHPSPDRLRRLAAGGITLGAHLLLLVMLLALGRQHGARREANIPLILVTDPVPPPPIPPRHRAPAPKAAVRAVARTPQPAAPAPPLTAPPPIVPLPLAAPIPTGPSGSGTGGAGQGTGGGGGGAGGDGDGPGDGTPPVRIGGRIRDRDYPASLSEAGISGTVSVRYRVGTDGRVSDCTITGSSGSAALDAHTCDLIEQRFRFRPSRDADGRPVPAIIVENHSWLIPAAPPAQARPGGQS